MDELEFRKKVYANPEDPGQEALAAARENPGYQKILEQTRKLDGELARLVNGVAVPPGLAERLLQLPGQLPDREADDAGDEPAAAFRKASLFQYYAIAASLLLAVGFIFSVLLNPARSPTEIALGDEITLGNRVLAHIQEENAELNGIRSGTLQTSYNLAEVNQVLANAGSVIRSDSFMDTMPVRYANPCLVLPGFRSSHLILQSADGPLNVIVVNNSPISGELRFRDDRYNGIIIPMAAGNLILLGEAEADLTRYRELFTDNVGWTI